MKQSKHSTDSYDTPEIECYNLEYISDTDMDDLISWIRLVRRVHHKNLLTITEIVLRDCVISVSYIIPRHGSLENILCHKHNQFGIACESVLSSLVHQTASALSHLHRSMGLVHRAVCPSSVFFDSRGLVKLGKLDNCVQLDWPASKCTDYPTGRPQLIPWYSPEIIEQEFYGYSFNSDVYSLGLLLATAFTNRIPYDDCDPPLIMLKKLSLVDIPTLETVSDRSDASPQMLEFYKLCIVHNPRERVDIDYLLNHSWLLNRNHCSKSSWKKLISE